MIGRQPREHIYWLIDQFLAGAMSAHDFAASFTHAYTNDADDHTFPEREVAILRDLFDTASWYALPEERSAYPKYRTESDVEEAARRAKSVITRSTN